MELRHDSKTAREFVEQVLRTGLMLTDLLANLLEDLPDDAFPGEEPAEVVIEMVAGTIAPAVDAAGARTVQQATALLGATADRVLADLRTAVELSRGGAQPDR